MSVNAEKVNEVPKTIILLLSFPGLAAIVIANAVTAQTRPPPSDARLQTSN